MEWKRSFLSRLFGAGQEETEATEEALAPPPEAAIPPEQLRHRLELPESHAIYKLWTIYSGQMEEPPPLPELALEGPMDPLLPDSTGKAELVRLQMAVNSTANGRMERVRSGTKQAKGEELPVLPDLDAQVTVFLSKDCLTAWVLVYPPVSGGRELERKDLDRALEEQQVSFGVDTARLDALVQDRERYFKLVPVARGADTVAGVDGCIVDMFPRTQEHKLTVDEYNRVDYTNLGFIHSVEKGGVICRIVPPTDGRPGRTVRDQEISAKNGKPASAPKGRNTELSEDGQALVASITGHVEFSGRSFQVKPVLDVPGNVDFSVGDINFLGDVCIHGDVCGGFTVRATGNITVEGVVEACTLEAGRDLVVARGVQGDSQAVIRAQRSIFAKYLENSCVYAKQDLETECIINCDVYCGGNVTVRSGHSKIIGGKVHAAHEVSAGIVGSRVGNRTDVVLGGQPCEEFDCQLLTKEIRELEETMERTSRQPESPSKASRLGRLRVQLVVSRGKLDAIQKEQEALVLEPQDPGVRRMKCDTVFPGTVLTIDEAVCHIDDVLRPCSASLVDGEIQLI